MLDAPAFSVQYHPEAGPGPHDARYLFDEFARLLMEREPADAAGATTSRSILLIGIGPDRDRPGVRVRLLGHAGVPRAARRGLPGHPRQLEPGHDHDRPRLRRRAPTSSRSTSTSSTQIIERERPDARAADARRPDRAQPGHGARRARACSSAYGRRADRRQRRGHRHRRGPRAVQGGDERDRPARCRRRASPTRSTRRSRSPSAIGLPGHHPARRTSSAAGAPASPSTPRSSARIAAAGLDASPISEILIERRSPGGRSTSSRSCATAPTTAWSSARSRTSTRWACTPATRSRWRRPRRCRDVEYQRDARRRVRLHPPRRRRDRRLATCSSPSTPHNGDMVIIEMNPRVSRSSALAVEGHRLPDRQDRRPARRRLHARRDPQRHHPQDAGQLRADHRLRRHQGPALGVREVPRHHRRARHADAVGRRGDGHRPHVPRVACRRACARSSTAGSGSTAIPAEAAVRRRSPTTSCCAAAAIATPDGPFQLEAALRRGVERRAGRRRPPRVDPWFLDQMLADHRGAGAPRRRRGLGGHDPAATGGGPSGSASPTPSSRTCGARPRPTVRGGPPRRRRAGHVQDRRHLRAPSSRPRRRTTTRPTRTRTRSRPPTRPKVVILGSGPNRIGQGIEFDYCCVHASFALRDAGFETVMVNCNPETVSTDYDTSRPPLLRAAHPRGRAQRHRGRAARRP